MKQVKFYNAYVLYRIRKELNITQEQMAQFMGVKKSRYRQVEMAKSGIKSEEIQLFLLKLNIAYAEYAKLIDYIHLHCIKDEVYKPTSPKYFGHLLPIEHLKKVSINIVNISHVARLIYFKKGVVANG